MHSRAALLVVLFTPLAVSAKAPPHRAAEARRHYDAGTEAYKAGDYDKAIEEFEAGYQLKPEPQQLYNLGQSCRLAHHPERARDYYQQYLEAMPDAPNRTTVEQRLAEVEKEIEAKNAPPPPPTPAPAAATAPVEPAAHPKAAARASASAGPTTPYQIGVHIRPLFVTEAMLAPYLDQRTSMEGFAIGGEFIYRRPRFDVVTSLDFSWLPVKDGNYLGKGNPPDLDTKFVEFRSLSFLSADVSIIGHNALKPWLEIRYGAGIGVGVVFGDVLVTSNFGGCTAQNASDIAACHPINVDLTSPDRETQLAATEAPGQKDTGGNPHRHSASEKPPAMVVINILAGFRFKIHPRVTLQIEGGFRNSAFVGVGAHYLF